MHYPGPLIAEQGAAYASYARPRTVRLWAVLGLVLAICALAAGLAIFADGSGQQVPQGAAEGKVRAIRPLDPAHLVVADPAQIETLTRRQALAVNAARPVSVLPSPMAGSFVLAQDDPGYRRALGCLTAAIYYEAAYEPADGQRAVAQVVLNRVRHPLFPHSVCGVVFQGAERATGCQFTFTCDGSLTRAPVPMVWMRAQAIAAQALSGQVFAPAGLSTHYHADYVVPYWAAMMVKTASIGQHAFYRLPDGYGRAAAFSARYDAREPQVALGMAAALAGDEAGALGMPPDGEGAMQAGDDARPILDRWGGTVAASNIRESVAGRSIAHNPARREKSGGRWVIPMDGNREALAPSIRYESMD